jgi:hypothetical protein
MAYAFMQEAETYFASEPDGMEPHMAVYYSILAGTGAIGIERLRASHAEIPRILERAYRFGEYARDILADHEPEHGVIRLEQLQLERYAGRKDSVVDGAQELITRERTFGRPQSDAALQANLLLHLTQKDTVVLLDTMIAQFKESAEIQPGVDIPAEYRVSFVNIERMLGDRDIARSIGRLQDGVDTNGKVSLQDFLEELESSRDSRAQQVDSYFRREARIARNPRDALASLENLHAMYEGISQDQRANELQAAIDTLKERLQDLR